MNFHTVIFLTLLFLNGENFGEGRHATATLLPDATMPATVLTEVAAIAAAPELADNPRTLTTYDADGRVTATTDPLGNTTTFTYDAAARRTSSSSSSANQPSTLNSQQSYDPAGKSRGQ